MAISPALQATSRSYFVGAERYLNNHMLTEAQPELRQVLPTRRAARPRAPMNH
jgi:hypothetical protein